MIFWLFIEYWTRHYQFFRPISDTMNLRGPICLKRLFLTHKSMNVRHSVECGVNESTYILFVDRVFLLF